MGKNERYVVGLDIGTTKICCVVGEISDTGTVSIVGMGESPSRGLRKGVVVNLEATVEAVKAAVAEAELMAGVSVESATIGVAGGHIRSFNSRGVVSIASRDRRIFVKNQVRIDLVCVQGLGQFAWLAWCLHAGRRITRASPLATQVIEK